jgi:diguanylate cyclase (GGDEF)-like protein
MDPRRLKPPPTHEVPTLKERDLGFDDEISTQTIPPPLPREPSGSSYLVLLYGTYVGQVFTLGEGQVTIGRDRRCQVQLPEMSVSRHHVTIVNHDGGFVLYDIGSRNGTFVNDDRVEQPTQLSNDDRIRIGKQTVLKFVDGSDPEADYVLHMYDAAMTDVLTGIYNRRYLDAQLEKEISYGRRHGLPLAVVMLDLDRFKDVNDLLGHQAGDQLLREFAELVRSTIRVEDTLGRYGGEEFLVICRSTDGQGATVEAERIRRVTADHLFCPESHQIRITVSAGVAAALRLKEQTAQSILERADLALYEAKNTGRNRVIAFPDE